jgi:ubiquinone/menaquinone biosynthesis C-methylase UbiE
MSATATQDRNYEAEHPEAYGSKGLRMVDHAGIWLRTRSLRRLVKEESPMRMLDLGCGYQANVAQSMVNTIPHVVGVDLEIDPKVKGTPGIDFFEGPIEVALASFEPESFDLVTILSVLEHIPEPQEVLDGIHRVLAPGGTAIVHVPTWVGKPVLEWLAFKRGMGTASINDHRMYYRIAELWPLMIRAGFISQDVKMRYHTLGCALTATARRRV